MKVEYFLNLLLITSLVPFLIRWAINWGLLNTINNTSYSIFPTNYLVDDFWGFLKHIAISEWKFWWFHLEDHRKLKIASNFFSAAFYLLIAIKIITIIIAYRI